MVSITGCIGIKYFGPNFIILCPYFCYFIFFLVVFCKDLYKKSLAKIKPTLNNYQIVQWTRVIFCMSRHINNTRSPSYICPLTWSDLQGKKKVHQCNICNKRYYWCEYETDCKKSFSRKNCAAFNSNAFLLCSNQNLLVEDT